MINIISLDSINTLLLRVSEEVLDKNLNKFILHNLKEKNNFTKNHSIFYNYLNLTKEYFVCFFEKSANNLTIIDLILEYLKNKNIVEKKVLVYYEEYFLLFDSSKFYYFQKIDKELKSQDINEYIKKRFMFYIDEIYYINKSDLPENNLLKSTLNYIKSNTNIKIYFSYLFVLLMIFLGLVFYNYYIEVLESREKLLLEEKEKIQKNSIVLKNRLYYKLSLLFYEIDENDLKVLKLDYSKKSLNLTLFSKNRDNAYNFFKQYKNIKINSFLKNGDGYEINTSFAF